MEVRMKSPPACFWKILTADQWNNLSNEQQDIIVESAKIITPITNFNPLSNEDH